ncbi:hypothetical protein OY671_009270, partial [Metschnikowia pulcherrima]
MGYKEAGRAIFDANITNVIAAVRRFAVGTGPVRGFAVVLMIGIVTSVFTAVTMTRMWETKDMKLLKLIPDNTNIHFSKWRSPFYIVSSSSMAGSSTSVATRGLNSGVDFVGGQMIRVTFERSAEAPVAQSRGEVDKSGYGEPIIQRYGKPNEISIRMKSPEGSDHDPASSDKMARTITAAIQAAHADA